MGNLHDICRHRYCIQCKYTDCVSVCPVSCFYEGPNFLVIHPDECIDCDACVAECPVEAIFDENELPAEKQHFLLINEELAQKWPQILDPKDPLPEADKWANVDNKLEHLIKTAPEH